VTEHPTDEVLWDERFESRTVGAIVSRLRTIYLVLGWLMLAAALYFALAGEYWQASWAVVAGMGFFLHTCVWGSPSLSAVVLWATFVSGLAALGRSSWWIVGVIGLVAIAVIALLEAVSGVRSVRGLRDVELERRLPDKVPPDAEDIVAEFESKGFRRVGGHRWRFGENHSDTIVLIGPRADRFAAVGRGAELVSRFGVRRLVTTTSIDWPVPRDVLRQEAAHGGAGELEAAHQAALDLLAARGLRADSLRDTELSDGAREDARRIVRFHSDAPLRSLLRMHVRVTRMEIRQEREEQVLRDDARSWRRIDAWLSAPVVT
jgi:hypothetical protein